MDVSAVIGAMKREKVLACTSVPDGLIAPLLSAISEDKAMTHIPCAREEECLGVAAGYSFCGERALILIQNAGLLNALGGFATLAQRYSLPLVVLCVNRGGMGDANVYDIEKRLLMDSIAPQLLTNVVRFAKDDLPSKLMEAYAWAEAARRPIILLMDRR